jgi:flagellar protein FliS
MQPSTAQDHYLVMEVNAATPQKLQLLLIEAALRLANRARQFWQQGRGDRAIESLDHARSILAEMRTGIKYEIAGELGERISAVYEFIFRCLVNAGCHHDEKSLDDAIRILEIERETWRQLCEKLAHESSRANLDNEQRGFLPPLGDLNSSSQRTGFSVEA